MQMRNFLAKFEGALKAESVSEERWFRPSIYSTVEDAFLLLQHCQYPFTLTPVFLRLKTLHQYTRSK